MQKKPIGSCLVVLLMILFLFGSAQAETFSLKYLHTDNIKCGFSISNGIASCVGAVTPSSKSLKASVSVKLQKKSGNRWATVTSWYASSAAGKIASTGGTKKLVKGNSYRVAVYGKIKNSSGTLLESPIKISGVKTY
ncbi:MAG: hypothetical protein PHP22_12055 [Oscillospiraceae bacterium]|nr:hypothetical protein [Oscillospiraceae bacterium]